MTDRGADLSGWLAALEARHLADLRLPEAARALRALSSAYVERRQALARGAALDSAGKRAAFALFYAPLHFLVTRHIVEALGTGAPATIVDLGCGTGAAGAAWSLACATRPRIVGIDRHPWAVQEARWTWRQLRVDGRARQGDLVNIRLPHGSLGVLAAYVLNELPDPARAAVVERLVDASGRGARVLVIEPIARGVTRWWDAVRARVEEAGGRADEWDIPLDRPPLVAQLDTAAGLNHRRVKARSLFIARSR
ncbi:MAG: methyltransferase domain-containing protein [Vicinamibacterales bacterium]